MARFSLIALVLAVIYTASVTLAANDWGKPCLNGECSYEISPDSGASGLLTLYSHPKGLTDITPAAGWILLDCDPNVLKQSFRLVCQHEEVDSLCKHVFDYAGPLNKVVRLPESCGNGPFARIASMSPAEDQEIPSPFHHHLRRGENRAKNRATVYTMEIDTNWAALDRATSGDVFFVFIGFNSPGIDMNLAKVDFDWGDIDFSKWVNDAKEKLTETVRKGTQWLGDQWDKVKIAAEDLASFRLSPQVQDSPINITGNHSFTKDIDIGCNAEASVDVSLKTQGTVTVKAGAVIAGNFLSEKIIEEIGVFGGLSGGASIALHLGLQISGGFDTKEQPLISDVGLPGFSIDGVFTIGPYLSLAGRVHGEMEVDISADVNLNYSFSDVQVWFPQDLQSKALIDGVSNANSDLSFSAAGKAQARGVIQGELIPSIKFGITIAGGKAAEASVSLSAPIWSRASVEVTAEASSNSTVALFKAPTAGRKSKVLKKAGSRNKLPSKRPSKSHASAGNGNLVHAKKAGSKAKAPQKKSTGKASKPKGGKKAKAPKNKKAKRTVLSSDISTELNACFWLEAGISLTASARGSILKYNLETKKHTLIESPSWELFSKCWSSGQDEEPPQSPTWAKDLLSKSRSSQATCHSGKALPSKAPGTVKGNS